MTDNENPLQELLSELREAIDSIKEKASLAEVSGEVNEATKLATTLSDSLKPLESAGYAFLDTLKTQLSNAQTSWAGIASGIHAHIEKFATPLKTEVLQLELLLKQTELALTNSVLFNSLKSSAEDKAKELERKAEEAAEALRQQYEATKTALEAIESHVTDVVWSLEQFKESGLELESGESVFIATKAEWASTGKGSDDPDGNLYVTNKRLIFEQNEKKGKFLGLFGGKQVQAALWDIALTDITGISTENKGFFGGKSMLMISTSHPEYAELPLEIKGGFGNKRFAGLLEQAKRGEFSIPVEPTE